MKIARFKKDCLGVPEGFIYPRKYEAGSVLPLDDSLFEQFVLMGVAEEAYDLDSVYENNQINNAEEKQFKSIKKKRKGLK